MRKQGGGNHLKVAQNNRIIARIQFSPLKKEKRNYGKYSSAAEYPNTLTTVDS